MVAILRDSTVVRTRPRAIPLAMITMRKSIYGLPSVSYQGMRLRLGYAISHAISHDAFFVFSNVTATTTISGPTTIIFRVVTTTWRPKMIGALAARAWERPTTVFHANCTTVVAVQSNRDTALYSRAAKEHVMLRTITSQEILVW